MVSDRLDRAALSAEQAIAELRDKAGSELDPELVEKFIGCLERSPQDLLTEAPGKTAFPTGIPQKDRSPA